MANEYHEDVSKNERSIEKFWNGAPRRLVLSSRLLQTSCSVAMRETKNAG